MTEQFKSGDKIVCISPDPLKLLKKGQVYTVDCIFIRETAFSNLPELVRLKEETTTDWVPSRFKRYVARPPKPQLDPVEKIMRKIGYKANHTTKK